MPESLGRYQIVRELGRGGMGVVYEATDPTIGRAVALKTIRLDAASIKAEELSQRFKNEARAAGQLNHPNIVTVYDAGEQDGILYIAMELLEGRTLQTVLANPLRLPVDEAINIARQICSGLQFAHSKGIVHRDIKPGNIMLASHGFLKITDFGIASTGEALTLSGQVLGTPHYMSPEQVLGKPLDARSDLFSVGVIVYEMLTGERPFDGQSMTTVMYKIVHETPVPPRAVDTAIHPGLSAVIEKALAKSTELRYQSGAALAAALENYRALDPAQVATVEVSALSQTATATVTTPASPTDVPPQPGPRTGAVGGGAPVAPPLTAGSRRRVPLYLLAALVGGLVVLGWILYHRAPSTIGTTSTRASSGPESLPAQPTASELSREPTNQPGAAPPSSVSVFRRASPYKNTAQMTVNSSPPGAQILVDGALTGKKTPAIVEMPRGEHTVSLQLKSFQPSSARFKVHGGEEFEFAPTLSVAMPNMPAIPQVSIPNIDLSSLRDQGMNGRMAAHAARAEGEMWRRWGERVESGELVIMVSTEPPGARILLDGQDTGKKSPNVIPLSAAGKHSVQVQLPGFHAEQRQVDVQPHTPGQLQIILHAAGAAESSD